MVHNSKLPMRLSILFLANNKNLLKFSTPLFYNVQILKLRSFQLCIQSIIFLPNVNHFEFLKILCLYINNFKVLSNDIQNNYITLYSVKYNIVKTSSYETED